MKTDDKMKNEKIKNKTRAKTINELIIYATRLKQFDGEFLSREKKKRKQ